jgi:hypothetical protein
MENQLIEADNFTVFLADSPDGQQVRTVTRQDAIRLFGISKGQFYDYIQRGLVRVFRKNRVIYVAYDDLVKLLKNPKYKRHSKAS